MNVDEPRIVRARISLAELTQIASLGFGDMVKAAVDVGRGIMAIGGELHSDDEALVLERGVNDRALQERIRTIVGSLVTR